MFTNATETIECYLDLSYHLLFLDRVVSINISIDFLYLCIEVVVDFVKVFPKLEIKAIN